MSLSESDKIIIKDMIKQALEDKQCSFEKSERSLIHRLCENGHIKRLLQLSEAVKESGVTSATLTGLFGMSVLGSNLTKRILSMFLIGLVVAGLLGLLYIVGSNYLPHLVW